MITLALSLVLTLALSAVFTAAELALFSLGETRIRALADEGVRGTAALQELRAAPGRLLVLVRLGLASSHAATAILAGAIGSAAHGPTGFVAGAVLGIALVVLLGDLVATRVTMHRVTEVALAVSPALLVLSRLLVPILWVFERLSRVSDGRPSPIRFVTESDIRELTALGHTEGEIEEHERKLIEGAFELDDRTAWDVMTPRVDIFAWKDSLRLADIAPELGAVRYSRVPVYGESIDQVTGVLYLRDAYQALLSGQHDVPLRELSREPLFVPGSVPLPQLLRDFQARRIHLAVVLDEYGGTDGLVTLEDVLEELVGEINDEHDPAEELITRISRDEIVAAGDADLREINHQLNVRLPELEHRSLNGLVLEEFGRVPEAGEVLERDDLVIEVLEASETQVLKARLRLRSPATDAVPAASEPAAGTPSGADAVEDRPSVEVETPEPVMARIRG